jgi:predicted ATPase
MLDLWLRSLEVAPSRREQFPFNLPMMRNGLALNFASPVTFFAGENGTGKSTLLEVLALRCGLPTLGASDTDFDPSLRSLRDLSDDLHLKWRRRATHGFFARAEDFFGFQKRINQTRRDLELQIRDYETQLGDNREENKNIERAIGYIRGQIHELEARYGEDADARSHGEAFLNAFQARISAPGLYLLDEPEAALSPLRQMALLKLVKDAVEVGSQFIIATHSPLLLRLGEVHIIDFDQLPPRICEWEDLSSVRLWRAFWSAPDAFLRRL